MNEKFEDLLNNSERVLEVSTFHNAWDGPRNVSCYDEPYCIPVTNLKEGKRYGGEYRFTIEKIEDERITISFEGATLVAEFGKGDVRTTISEAKPYMICYETTLYFEFREIDPVRRLEELVFNLEWEYKNRRWDMDMEKAAEDKKLIFALIDSHIKNGHNELYPMKALLTSAEDWYDFRITDQANYRDTMREGYKKTCMKGKERVAVKWLKKAWEYNSLNQIIGKDTIMKSYFKKP